MDIMQKPNDFDRLRRQVTAELEDPDGERRHAKKSLQELVQEVIRLTDAVADAPKPAEKATQYEDHSIERAAAHLRLPDVAQSKFDHVVSPEHERSNPAAQGFEADGTLVERKLWRGPLRWAAYAACLLMIVIAVGTVLNLVHGQIDKISASEPPVPSASQQPAEIAIPKGTAEEKTPKTAPEPEVVAKSVPDAGEPPRQTENAIAKSPQEPISVASAPPLSTPAVAAGAASAATVGQYVAKRPAHRRQSGARVRRHAVHDH